MKTLALSLIVLALTACTANPTKTSAPAKDAASETSSAKAQEATPATAQPEGPTGTPAQAAKNCVCVKMWMPVCGKNNKTYGNSCEADCAGVKYTQGACEAKK